MFRIKTITISVLTLIVIGYAQVNFQANNHISNHSEPYFIIARAKEALYTHVNINGYSNLPAGSIIKIMVGEEHLNYFVKFSHSIYIAVPPNGHFVTNILPIHNLMFRKGLVCIMRFSLNNPRQPKYIIKQFDENLLKLGSRKNDPEILINNKVLHLITIIH